jgi:hypothetical protein
MMSEVAKLHQKEDLFLMEIAQEHKGHIEKITSEMECPKDFICLESDFENLSKIKLIAGGERIVCLEEEQLRCKFALCYGSLTLCQCPLRNYIAKNLSM